jgi:hypothetical protein
MMIDDIEIIIRAWNDDILNMTYLAEPRPLLPEQCGFRDATGVHAAERDASASVIPPMQFRDRHHVANLRILVGLRTEERLAVGHGDRLSRTFFEALKITKVRLGVNQSTALFEYSIFTQITMRVWGGEEVPEVGSLGGKLG